jgi:hypothetical protein
VSDLRALGRLQLLGAALLVTASAAAIARTLAASETVFLGDAGGAAWIQAPFPVRRGPWTVRADAVPTASFGHRFELSRVDAGVALELRGWREVTVELDGAPVAGLEARALLGREPLRVPLGDRLGPGPHAIRLRVRNPSGPPLVAARLVGVDPPVATGAGWTAEMGERVEAPALVADDTRPPGELLALPSPAAGLRARAAPLAGAFALGAAGFALGRRRLGPARLARLPTHLCVAVSLAWLALFAHTAPRVPLWAGPDSLRHVEYARWIREHAALPLADAGWAMYHPPLFYVASAGALALADPAPDGAAERVALRILPALATLGCVWIAWALARRVFPGDPRLALFATAFAAILPMNLLLATYVSNESLHALLSNLALLAAARLLLAERVGARGAAGLGALLGLAVLAKVTSLLLVPIAAAALALRTLALDRASLARTAGICAALVAAAALVCGGFFARNWLHFGQPLVWNQAIPGGEAFWQEPGFRTARYYLGFGEALRHPFAASFRSLADALYATSFGDGDTGGVTDLAAWRALWDVPAMSAAYLLGLPLAALLAVGGARLVAGAMRGADARRRLVFTLLAAAVWTLGVALAQRSLAAPYYSFVKATFALGVSAPLAIAAALGLDSAWRGRARRGAPGPAALCGWLAALAAAVALAIAG